MKSLNNKIFLQQICFNTLPAVTGVATLLLGLHGFFQSLAAKYFLTLILWDFSMQCGLGFFYHFTLAWFTDVFACKKILCQSCTNKN